MPAILRTDADAIIPVEESTEILKSIPQSSAALKLMRRLPNMSATVRNIPVMSQLAAGGFVNGDTGLKMTSKYAWLNKTLNVEEIAVIIPIPEAVIDDASYDIWAEIRPFIAAEFGRIIDGAVFFGTDKPTSWPNGIVPQAIAAGNQAVRGTGQDLASDISSTMSMVELDGYPNSGFAADLTLRGELRDLRDANRNFLYQPSMQAGTPNALYATQIEYVENGGWDNTAAQLLTGDWRQAVWALRQDLTYKVLTEAVITDADNQIIYNLAQQDMIGLRVKMRLAWQVANPVNALNSNAATRFPFAALVPATP